MLNNEVADRLRYEAALKAVELAVHKLEICAYGINQLRDLEKRNRCRLMLARLQDSVEERDAEPGA